MVNVCECEGTGVERENAGGCVQAFAGSQKSCGDFSGVVILGVRRYAQSLGSVE